MITRSFCSVALALTLGMATLGATSGTASAGGGYMPKGPGKIAMPHQFPKPHGPHGHKHGKGDYGGGWGPGIGIGLGVAALGIAAAHAYDDDDCYVKRVVNVYGEEFYRQVCN
jgi:hypothetical protein